MALHSQGKCAPLPATWASLASWQPCSSPPPRRLSFGLGHPFCKARWSWQDETVQSHPGEGEESQEKPSAQDAGQGMSSECYHLRAFLGVSFQGQDNWEIVMGKPKYMPLAALQCVSEPGQVENTSLRDLFLPHCPCEQCLVALEARSLGLQKPLTNSKPCLSLTWLYQ